MRSRAFGVNVNTVCCMINCVFVICFYLISPLLSVYFPLALPQISMNVRRPQTSVCTDVRTRTGTMSVRVPRDRSGWQTENLVLVRKQSLQYLLVN